MAPLGAYALLIGLMNLAIIAAVISILAALIMVCWNYSVPRIVSSVDSTYDRGTYKNIDYATSLVITILLSLVFGNSRFSSVMYRPSADEERLIGI